MSDSVISELENEKQGLLQELQNHPENRDEIMAVLEELEATIAAAKEEQQNSAKNQQMTKTTQQPTNAPPKKKYTLMNVGDFVYGLFNKVWYVAKIEDVILPKTSQQETKEQTEEFFLKKQTFSNNPSSSSISASMMNDDAFLEKVEYRVKYVGYDNEDTVSFEKKNVKQYVDPPVALFAPGKKCLALYESTFYMAKIDKLNAEERTVWVTLESNGFIQESSFPFIRAVEDLGFYRQPFDANFSEFFVPVAPNAGKDGKNNKRKREGEEVEKTNEEKQKNEENVSKRRKKNNEIEESQKSWKSFLNSAKTKNLKGASQVATDSSLSAAQKQAHETKPGNVQKKAFQPVRGAADKKITFI